MHFSTILPTIEAMPENSLDEIADKYVEINVAHPFMEGNGRSVVDPAPIKALLSGALTDKIDDRETFMKGIDYSYYYEQSE